MAEWAARELAPGPDAVTDDELIDYIHKTHNTVYHPACTAHMGPDSDREAVVDPRLRVRGIQGLRVADGSIMPFLPAINPCITTMMIGEKCADVQRVAAAADVEVHPAGTTVFSQGAEPVGHLRIVRSGAVELVLDGRVL